VSELEEKSTRFVRDVMYPSLHMREAEYKINLDFVCDQSLLSVVQNQRVLVWQYEIDAGISFQEIGERFNAICAELATPEPKS
jgi:hypothetical protein